LREAISAQMSRGKVECRVSFSARATGQYPGTHQSPLVASTAQWNAEVRDILPAARNLDVADILRWNGILESNAMIADKLHDNVLDLLQQTLRDSTPHVRAKVKN